MSTFECRDLPIGPDAAKWQGPDVLAFLTEFYDRKIAKRGLTRASTVVITRMVYVPEDLCLSVDISARVTGSFDGLLETDGIELPV